MMWSMRAERLQTIKKGWRGHLYPRYSYGAVEREWIQYHWAHCTVPPYNEGKGLLKSATIHVDVRNYLINRWSNVANYMNK